MRLVIVGHGETDWTVASRYTGTTDVDLTANGRHQAASLQSLLERVLHGQRPVLSSRTQPVVVTHGHFSRILAARTLRLSPEYGHLFASATAGVSLIEDHHGERGIGLWNVDATLLADSVDRTAQPDVRRADRLRSAAGVLQ